MASEENGKSPSQNGDPPSPDKNEDASAEFDKEKELGGKMGFIQHLEELRRRIIICVATVGVSFLVIYSTSINTIAEFFMMPLRKVVEQYGSFMYTSMAEGFLFNLKLAAVTAMFVSSPMIFYQVWSFIAPGLYKRERIYIGPFIVFSTLFFTGGAAFFYFVVFPIGARFFAQFAEVDWIEFNPKLSETFSFVVMMLFAFGLVFEMPVVTFLLARLGIVNVGFLNRNRKYALLIIFTLGAFFTPPDVVSQLLLAGPMWILFELSVLITWIFGPKKKKTED